MGKERNLGKERARENFEREKDILESITSNFVVRYEGTSELTDEGSCLLLEFCNGGDLKNYISCRGGTLEEKEAHFYLR